MTPGILSVALCFSAQQIVNSVGSDQPDAVIASTVVAFALSSILTGIAFFLLGALNLGSLIGFFPRHILVGTIGGVGWFLITTGIEVSGRLDENLAYTLPMLRKIFLDTQILSRWLTALAAALLLRALQARVKSPLLVPAFFMVLPLTFYLLVFICRLDISHVRDAGWIFPLVESDQPFWHFYTYYDFTQVDWAAVVKTLPAMLALTFFGKQPISETDRCPRVCVCMCAFLIATCSCRCPSRAHQRSSVGCIDKQG